MREIQPRPELNADCPEQRRRLHEDQERDRKIRKGAYMRIGAGGVGIIATVAAFTYREWTAVISVAAVLFIMWVDHHYDP